MPESHATGRRRFDSKRPAVNVQPKDPEPFGPESGSKEVDLPVGEPSLDQPTPDLVPNRLKE